MSKTVTAPKKNAPAPSSAVVPGATHAESGGGRKTAKVNKVFVCVIRPGALGSMDSVGIHEVPLLRAKLRAFGSLINISTNWMQGVPREREVTKRSLMEEFERMERNYIYTPPNARDDRDTVDLVRQFYGELNSGRLLAVMASISKAWDALVLKLDGKGPSVEDFTELIKLAEPEASMIDLDDGIDPDLEEGERG